MVYFAKFIAYYFLTSTLGPKDFVFLDTQYMDIIQGLSDINSFWSCHITQGSKWLAGNLECFSNDYLPLVKNNHVHECSKKCTIRTKVERIYSLRYDTIYVEVRIGAPELAKHRYKHRIL